MWHSAVNHADKVTASSLDVITAASGRAPTDVPQLSMNTAVFKLSRLAVESQKTGFALCVTISWTLAMREVTRAKRKGMASVFLVSVSVHPCSFQLLLHKVEEVLARPLFSCSLLYRCTTSSSRSNIACPFSCPMLSDCHFLKRR